jgi:hypothetical protein
VLTCVEESVIARHRIKATIIKINSSQHHSQLKMRGNVITFSQKPDNIIDILPNNLNNELFQVYFNTINFNYK